MPTRPKVADPPKRAVTSPAAKTPDASAGKRVFAVANVRATTAKTLTCTCLTTWLAVRGKTLLIDADARTETTRGHPITPPVHSLRAVLLDGVPLASAVQTVSRQALRYDVLPAGPDMMLPLTAEDVTPQQVARLREALSAYRYVVIDTPSAPLYWLDLALQLASDIVVPVTPTEECLNGARIVQARIAEIVTAGLPHPAVFALVCGGLAEDAKEQQRDAQNLFGSGVLQSTVLYVQTIAELMPLYADVAEELLRRGR